MKVYELMDAISNLEALMNEAWAKGPVRIRQRLGRDFMLMPWNVPSPLDALAGVDELFDELWEDDDDEEDFEFDGEGIFGPTRGPMNGKAA